jgi:branched-chain amino acid transport system permease protein
MECNVAPIVCIHRRQEGYARENGLGVKNESKPNEKTEMITGTVILQALVYGLLNGSIYGLFAIGFLLTFGVMEIVNFSYGQMAILSMFVTFFLFAYLKIDPFISIFVTIPLFFIFGTVIYKTAIQWIIKIPFQMQMMATLGLVIFMEHLMLLSFTATPRGISTSYAAATFPLWGDVKVSLLRAIPAGICYIVLISLFLFLNRTTFGKCIRATAADKEGALLVGIKTRKVFMIAFSLACVLESIVGSSIMAFSVVDPYSGFRIFMKAWVVVALAGLSSIPGAIVGGLILGIMEALSSVFISASLGSGIIFLIVILVLIFKPAGIFGKTME